MGQNYTLKIRRMATLPPKKINCAVIFIDGLASSDYLSEFIIKPITKASVLSAAHLLNRIDAAETEAEDDFERQIFALNSGDALLFIEGESTLIISAKGYMKRTPNEPAGEQVTVGAHEGFVEPIMHNLALLRRRVKSDRLKYEKLLLGKTAKSCIALCYIDGVADYKLIERVKRRIDKIKDKDIQNINALCENIKDIPYSVFQTVSVTERPDIASAKLMEGRIAIMLDGSAAVITAPAVFTEFFQTADDYYLNFYYGSINRVLRIICFFLTVSIPGIYVGILTYHRELLPTNLLISIASARAGVPFPLLLETVILLGAFDLLKDASAHVSSGLGQSLSIVGALILGDSAVSAHFISAPLVIITAATGITGLINNNIRSASVVWRYILLMLSAAAGLYGYLFGSVLMLLSISRMESFGVPYSMDIMPLSLGQLRDSIIRSSWKKLNYKNIFKRGTR